MIEVPQAKAPVAVVAPYYAFVAAAVLIALWFGMYLRRRKGRPE
jgi:hypothetical protein